METYDYVVIGGGIVGFSTAYHLGKSFPGARVLLLEKESSPAQHQTGRNSGVIHSGIYYKPGSFKAKFAKAGALSMVEFCKEHGIPYDVCGKVIVATKESELQQLENLYQRGLQNECPVEKVSPERVREIEPHVKCVAGVLVKSTGITSYVAVCRKYLELIEAAGGVVKFNQPVEAIDERGNVKVVKTPDAEYEAKFIINCAGLHSDRVARMAGADPGARIVPFRGEYFELTPEKRHLVKTLIYPVPNPDFPFLGVHFTKMIDGSVHAGPNAVLALKREGYFKSDFNLRDFSETMAFPGFWKLVSKNLGEGMKEMHRSFFKSAFVHSLQQLIPEVRAEDLVPCKAGVRAQALYDDGRLVDDFLIVKGKGTLHVCNAPSPAATASLEIGKSIVQQIS
jgi:L-2-hydroxyglutarate oxidase